MKSAKAFDCVKMKDDIQARLRQEWTGLTDEQVRERIHQELQTDDHAVARWWRSLDEADRPAQGTPRA